MSSLSLGQIAAIEYLKTAAGPVPPPPNRTPLPDTRPLPDWKSLAQQANMYRRGITDTMYAQHNRNEGPHRAPTWTEPSNWRNPRDDNWSNIETRTLLESPVPKQAPPPPNRTPLPDTRPLPDWTQLEQQAKIKPHPATFVRDVETRDLLESPVPKQAPPPPIQRPPVPIQRPPRG
jgi:hypothetical protein